FRKAPDRAVVRGNQKLEVCSWRPKIAFRVRRDAGGLRESVAASRGSWDRYAHQQVSCRVIGVHSPAGIFRDEETLAAWEKRHAPRIQEVRRLVVGPRAVRSKARDSITG